MKKIIIKVGLEPAPLWWLAVTLTISLNVTSRWQRKVLIKQKWITGWFVLLLHENNCHHCSEYIFISSSSALLCNVHHSQVSTIVHCVYCPCLGVFLTFFFFWGGGGVAFFGLATLITKVRIISQLDIIRLSFRDAGDNIDRVSVPAPSSGIYYSYWTRETNVNWSDNNACVNVSVSILVQHVVTQANLHRVQGL